MTLHSEDIDMINFNGENKRELLSDKIKRDVELFLSEGNKIKFCGPSEFGQIEKVTKRTYKSINKMRA